MIERLMYKDLKNRYSQFSQSEAGAQLGLARRYRGSWQVLSFASGSCECTCITNEGGPMMHKQGGMPEQ